MNKGIITAIEKAETLTEIIVSLMITGYKNKGFSSREVAEKLGIHKSGMSRIKNGKYQLDLSRFLIICAMTGQNPIELMKRAEALFTSAHEKHV
ncbi:helix-turn-helix domain-containing protein [Phaeodactylibacter xiamenensis]|uniref:helix-turn-helix domain-containing protein n=1 Tax=Phaeodactylibacter xiamenensis TaxID=1524460 RepID=UPI003CCBD3A6